MASHAAMLLDPRSYKRQLQSSAVNNESNKQDAARSPPSIARAPAGTMSVAHHLLNPRRFASQSRNPSSSARPSGTRIGSTIYQDKENPPLDINFEFCSPGTTDTNTGKRSYPQIDNRGEARAGSLIEDIYGVERRVNQPLKRAKTSESQDKAVTSSKASNFPTAGNSGLGKWMKEGPGTPDISPSPSIPNFVDLTLDTSLSTDDDDLQVTGSTNLSTQRVCYGKLDKAFIQAHLVPKPAARAIMFGHDWPSMKLGVERKLGSGNQIAVLDPHSKVFGMIDPKTASAIVPLLDSVVLKINILARLDVRKRAPGEEPWTPCSGNWRASINLYGLRKDAAIVGKYLGQNNVWLVAPNSVEQGIPVFNPHAEMRRAQPSFLPQSTLRGRVGMNYEVRTAEEINDAVMKMFDQLKSAENMPEMSPPCTVKTPLLRHQKQALWFMTEKEKPRRFGPNEEDNNSLWRIVDLPNGKRRYREIISGTLLNEAPPETFGGLLADMMGLGKTLSILSLVLTTLEDAGTWANMTPDPSLVRDLPGVRNTRTTLLVAPLSAVSNWVSQIKEHLDEKSLSYYVFHGASRTNNVDELAKYDLVITTYSIILSELSGRSSTRGVSPLTRMNMFRIVLDEAHTIREQTAAQTQAILKLNAQRRWSVTGTPIQNRLEDLFSVTKFLGLFPYNDRSRFGLQILSRFKTGDPTVLASLRVLVDSFTLRRVKDKINLPRRVDKIVMLTFSEEEMKLHEFFRRESNVMMKVIAGENKTKLGGRMYHHVLKAMMILRRVSAHGKELLDEEDRKRLKGLTSSNAIDLEDGDSESGKATDKKAYEMFTLMQDSSADVCAACSRRLEEQYTDNGAVDGKAAMAIVLPCLDVLCPECFSNWKQTFGSRAGTEARCQVCDGLIPTSYSVITPEGLQKFFADKERQSRKQEKTLGEYEGPHTKTKALLEHLLQTAEESKQLASCEPPIKSVIFSAWTSHLDLIEIALRDNGITGYTRLDGTMSLPARNKALDAFREDNRIVVLLATIGAGGVGLNLSSASNVYIMEPQYNPAAVAQAVDRVHRIGQTREVTTVQFIMKGSIEEKIFELAKKKQQLADMSMGKGKLDKREVQEQRMKEYRSLFK